jgi:hypothetical protein
MEIHDWHKSPLIRAALRDGRSAEDIGLVTCDRCGSISYCHRGSPCTCEWCGAGLDHLAAPDAGEVITLADLWDSAEALEEETARNWAAICPGHAP